MGALRWPKGQNHRDAQFRRIGAVEGPVEEIRHGSGQGRGGGEGSPRKVKRQ